MSIYDSSKRLADSLLSKFANPVSITVQRQVNTPDGAGGFVRTWNDLYAGLRAAVVPMSGEEVVDAQRLNYTATHNVYLYYPDAQGINSADRIVFDGRVFLVKDPRNVAEAGALLKVRCEEGR